jgi:hypothetical protein
MAVGLAVLLAAFLVVSRKTEGATALVPGAIGLMILLASYVHTLSRAGRPGWGIVATAHVVWTGVALVLLFQGIATVDSRHTFVMLCAAVGSVTAIFGLTALVRAAQTAAAAPRPHPDASA